MKMDVLVELRVRPHDHINPRGSQRSLPHTTFTVSMVVFQNEAPRRHAMSFGDQVFVVGHGVAEKREVCTQHPSVLGP